MGCRTHASFNHYFCFSQIRLSMTLCDLSDETEAPVAQRLMALQNVTVLNLTDNWTCVAEAGDFERPQFFQHHNLFFTFEKICFYFVLHSFSIAELNARDL